MVILLKTYTMDMGIASLLREHLLLKGKQFRLQTTIVVRNGSMRLIQLSDGLRHKYVAPIYKFPKSSCSLALCVSYSDD